MSGPPLITAFVLCVWLVTAGLPAGVIASPSTARHALEQREAESEKTTAKKRRKKKRRKKKRRKKKRARRSDDLQTVSASYRRLHPQLRGGGKARLAQRDVRAYGLGNVNVSPVAYDNNLSAVIAYRLSQLPGPVVDVDQGLVHRGAVVGDSTPNKFEIHAGQVNPHKIGPVASPNLTSRPGDPFRPAPRGGLA